MEDMIKGLVGVALGRVDNDEEEQRNSESLDERSRSTWSEAVSGDRENNEGRGRGDRRPGYCPIQGRREDQYLPDQEQWEVESSRTSNRPYKEQFRPKQEGWECENLSTSKIPQKLDGDNDDGWQTVGKKPPRKQHKVPKDQWHGYKRNPSEQEYSNDVEIDASIDPSEDELADVSQACNKLWDLDLNRLVPGKDYEIDRGDGKKVFQKEDMAQENLFTWVSDDVFRKPTFSRFCSLLDNYNPNEGDKEVVSSEERQEQVAFIEEISRTAPFKYLQKYLASSGIASGTYQDFKRMMTSLWFDLYGRGGTSGTSSAFEHVFVGEINNLVKQKFLAFIIGFSLP